MKKSFRNCLAYLLAFCLLVSYPLNAAIGDDIETDEEGGIWNWENGTYTAPDGSVYQIVGEDGSAAVTINSTNFPDDNFRAVVVSFDANKDGILSLAEIRDIKEIDVTGKNISSLTGINYFASLEILICNNNPLLKSLDLSKNEQLITLDCRFCPIEVLDMRHNRKLQALLCGGDKITADIDISNCSELVFFECFSNMLKALSFKNNPSLQSVSLAGNGLTELDVSENRELLELWCCQNEISELDVSNCTKLRKLDVADDKLTSLDVSKNTLLIRLGCPGNQLKKLDITNNKKLRIVYCEANNITSLDISRCENLNELVLTTEPYEMIEDRGSGRHKQWSNPDEYILAVDTYVSVITSNSANNTLSIEKIKNFIARCYHLILGREPDASGLDYWAGRLYSGEATAAEIIDGFVNSNEFRNKNLSYGDQVEVLYQVMLSRGSDASGKSYWVSMLSSGNPLAIIINGFCDSTEFKGICEEYGIKPGSVSGGSAAPAPAPAPAADMTKIRAFVTRNYRVILGREPDADGLNYWAQRLASGESTATEIINIFVNSDEFRSRNLSYGGQVEVLYQVMLDRGSDEAGKTYWVSMLNGGNPLGAIINGFCNSAEFTAICAEYGLTPGSVEVGELKPPKEVRVVDTNKIKGYITRCYRVILSREPDQGGLDYWTGKMASGELEAAAIIDQFVNSIEFKGKQLSNRDAVEVLYQAMLGRGSDEAGMGYWLAKLEAGDPFAVIINGFCNSQEFKGICAEYGITPGSVAVASVTTYANPEEAEEETPEQTPEQVPEQVPEQELAEPTPTDERTEKAKAFITYCYQSALLREPNTEEVDYYANQILSGQMTAKDVARAFAFSQEFQGKWTDNTAFVRVLYRLCLDREADADGLVYWTDKLANGETAVAVFNALTENKEFVQVCATYGVPAGVDANAIRAQEEAAAVAEANEAPAAPASEFTNEEKIRAFVSRFYRDAMGREADEEGLNYYTSRILNGEATPKDVAREIILSEEFRGRMPGNEDLVRILYRVYLGREADEEGLANWAGQLDSGVTLETILNGFAGSEEFATVVNGLR